VSGTFRNPVVTGERGEDHGDPFIVRYLDAFYLYHTGDTSGRRGVSVHRSQDLVHWEFAGYALEAAQQGWAWSDLWAPELVYERGVFYMYISATRRRSAGDRGVRWQRGEGAEAGRRLGLARSTSPLGPFVWDDRPLLDRWSIDGHPFRDDDGTMWLFYNVRTADERGYDGLPGTGTLCDRLLAPDRLEGRPRPVTFPSRPWEGNRSGDWFWNEGPYVVKRRGRYFQMYSGGSFEDETYGIGCAAAPNVGGPWEKREDNPQFTSSGRIHGPGHHSLVFGPDAATVYAVYHGYVPGDAGRKVHLDRLVWAGDAPRIVGPTDGEQTMPPQAVCDERVPHWRA
jgi:beta-xylosidase